MLKAISHRLSYCFKTFAHAVREQASRNHRARAALLVCESFRMTRDFQSWMAFAYVKRRIEAVASRSYRDLDPVRMFELVQIWKRRLEDDPRIISEGWPDNDEFDEIISISKKFFMRTREDGRTMDIQVRMTSGARIQMPVAVFRFPA